MTRYIMTQTRLAWIGHTDSKKGELTMKLTTLGLALLVAQGGLRAAPEGDLAVQIVDAMRQLPGVQAGHPYNDDTNAENRAGFGPTDVTVRGGRREVKEYAPTSTVLANLEAFADAAEGRAPYPVQQSQMIANIAALEAIFKSAASGEIVAVES